MKLYVSADIEGVTGIALWEETENGHSRYPYFAQQMTKEVSAACQGAMAAGAGDILIKDAHGSACNLIPDLLPEETRLYRGWGADIQSMVSGLDGSFGGLFCIGYHAGAGMDTNPLSHTVNTHNNYVKINGRIAPELYINGLTAAYYGVPVLLVTGDQGLCDWMRDLNPNVETVAVNQGVGRGTVSIHPNKALRLIREAAERAVRKDPGSCLIPLPEHFTVEISYKEHHRAKNAASYPGVIQTGPAEIRCETDDWMEARRALDHIL